MKNLTTKLVMIIAVILAGTGMGNFPGDVRALVKAHVAFLNAQTFVFEPDVEALKHQIIEKCAPAHLERLRNKAANESIKQSIGFVGKATGSSAALSLFLRKVAQLDEQGQIELQCLALLTIMREGHPETWKLIAKLNQGSNPDALKGVERMIDAVK